MLVGTTGSLLVWKMSRIRFVCWMITLALYNVVILLSVVSWNCPEAKPKDNKLPSYDPDKAMGGHHNTVVSSENVTTPSGCGLLFNRSSVSGNSSACCRSQPQYQNDKVNLSYGWRDNVNGKAAMSKFAFELMEYKPPVYTDTRAPCFFVEAHPSKKDAKLASELIVRCLPSVFLIGAPKSGTTDLYRYLTLHRHVISGKIKEPKFWNMNSKRLSPKNTFGQYLKTYDRLAKLTSHCFIQPLESQCQGLWRNTGILNTIIWKEVQPFMTVDASVNYMDDAIYWQNDPLNKGSEEVLVYTPHRIKHFVPQAKLVLMLRNPVDRLVSDFYFFVEGAQKLNADYFHTLVVNGIMWWTSCIRALSECRCAFGVNYAASGVPDLGNGTFSWGDLHGEGDNGAARLRVGLYVLYIQKWLEVFVKDDLLVIQMEQYSQNVSQVLERDLLPFLELETYETVEWNQIHSQEGLMHRNKNNKTRQVVHDKTRKLLEEFYRPYNIRLAKLLGHNRFMWL